MKAIQCGKKGQATLEMALSFIVVLIFLGGVFQIWLWSNNQIVRRQRTYNKTRVNAGTSSDGYQLQWPLNPGPQALEASDVLVGR